MKFLVTGATGFIGREIVSELSENNHQVIGLGNSKLGDNKEKKVTFFKANITDYHNLADLEKLQEVDVIIHSAGLAHQFGETSREQFEAVNVRGTENILKLAVKLKIKHFILIGSTAVYGIVPGNSNSGEKPFVIDEDTPTNPQTLYAESKLKSEIICRGVCEENKMGLTIFRLAPVIGEGNVGNVDRLIRAVEKNRFVWVGDGSNLKSLIYKRDVARACEALALKTGNGMEIFNLAAEPIKMKDFVDEIARRLDKKIIPIRIPASLLRGVFRLNQNTLKLKKVSKISETVEKWLSDDIYSADKIIQTYNFKAKTPIIEALDKQIKYYLANER